MFLLQNQTSVALSRQVGNKLPRGVNPNRSRILQASPPYIWNFSWFQENNCSEPINRSGLTVSSEVHRIFQNCLFRNKNLLCPNHLRERGWEHSMTAMNGSMDSCWELLRKQCLYRCDDKDPTYSRVHDFGNVSVHHGKNSGGSVAYYHHISGGSSLLVVTRGIWLTECRI